MMLMSYGAGRTVHVLGLVLACKQHGLRTETEAHFLGPLIVYGSDARRKLHRLGH
jgi:hypothetical protein